MKKEILPSWLKNAFFKAGEHFLVKLLTKLLMKIGLKLAGPIGWIASFFMDKLLKVAWEWVVIAAIAIKKYLITKEEIKETAKELKEYDGVINKPGSTQEEIKDAGEKFLNS